MTNSAFPAEIKLQFSGHETFPLRYGWLKKVFDAVVASEQEATDTKQVFSSADAIARFGVGKNMIASMRYWALAAGMISEVRAHLGPYATTTIAHRILADSGLDPWMEDPATLWFLHWKFTSTPYRTSTWYWVFNHCQQTTFDRAAIVEQLERLCKERQLKVARATLKRDVECFVRTYVGRAANETIEENLECPLTELSLIRPTGRKDTYQMMRGPKPTLNQQIFASATVEYWQRKHREVRTLSFVSVLHDPGSPGRVFALDEESLADYLISLEAVTEGAIIWSETAGMRQLIATTDLGCLDPHALLVKAYGRKRKAA